MGPLQSLASGALSYLMFAGIGGFVGYYFAKKRTEHEVGYLRRVEVVERIQRLVVLLAEEFEAALEYIRENLPTVTMWLAVVIGVLGVAVVVWRSRQARA